MFRDGFDTQNKIAGGNGYYWDSRQLVEPIRAKGQTHFAKNFSDMNGIAVHVDGSAAMGIINPQSGDPALASALQLATGANPGSDCRAQWTVNGIGPNFGVLLIPRLNAVDAGNPLCLEVQAANLKMLRVEFAPGSVRVFQDGAWQPLATHGGDYWTEWWIEVGDIGNGQHCVELWAGTELIELRTGVLPTGNVAGLVTLQQKNASAANRVSQVAALHIGLTQTPGDLVLQGAAWQASVPADIITLEFDVEDICNGVVLNEDFQAEVTIGTSGVWRPVTLADMGVTRKGKVDKTKDVRKFVGQYDWKTATGISIEAGWPIAYRVKSFNGKMYALASAGIDLTSVY